MGDVMFRFTSSLFKHVLFLFNFLFVVFGFILVVMGLLIRSQYMKYDELLGQHYLTLPSLLMWVGSMMIFVTFFGCCGAVQESYCLVFVFSVMLSLLFFVEVMIGLTAIAMKDGAYFELRANLNDTMVLYNKSAPITEAWDFTQANMECCGGESYKDWYPVLNNSLPMSCCGAEMGAIGAEKCDEKSTTLYDSGCLPMLSGLVRKNSSKAVFVAFLIAVTQVAGVFMACALSGRIRGQYENF